MSHRSGSAKRRRARALMAGVAALTVACHAAHAAPKLLLFGDSLTAGYGLPAAEGFGPQLGAALAAAGRPVEIVNAGVSGDTTAGGLARLEWTLADRPDYAIVELGANDMLRGLDPAQARRNLDQILSGLERRRIPTLVAGMRSAPNLGRDYQTAFEPIFGQLAAAHHDPLYPFFLDGVAGDAALIQADGLHPNAAGVARIVAAITPAVVRLLDGGNGAVPRS